MAEWSRVANTTIAKYVRTEEVNVMRNRALLAMMQSMGRVTFNMSGERINYKVRYKRAPLVGYADGDTLSFPRRDRWKQAELDWRGYSATDSMTKKERLMNKSTEQIIDIYAQLGKSLMDDIDDQFGDEFYIDGNLAANYKRMHGVESFFGNGGAAAAGYIASPSDTYMGLRTDLGNYGGDWSTVSTNVNWPTGTGDAHYDFWSPLIVDYTDTAWAASTKTWPNTCIEATRFGIVKSKKNKSKKGMLDLIIHNDELYRQFAGAFETYQQITISRGSKNSRMVALGFEDTINFDGVDVTYEYGIPTGVGYGFNTKHMELMSLQSVLFDVTGPDFSIETKSWRTSIDFFGNLIVNPRYQVKFQSVT